MLVAIGLEHATDVHAICHDWISAGLSDVAKSRAALPPTVILKDRVPVAEFLR